MSDAPETIWAWFSIPNIMHVGTWATTRFPDDATEYTRADLPLTTDQIMSYPRVKALAELLAEARSDLAVYVDQDYPPDTCAQYPDIARRHFRDMELCRQIDTAIAQLKEPKE